MTDQPTIAPLGGTVTVNAPLDAAFQVFVARFDIWWPHEYHIGASDVAEIVLEDHVGGRWYERGVDGRECDWGRVLAWEPPHRLVFTWQINGSWQFDPDPAHASEIEVTFAAEGPERTRVEVNHRFLERLVDGQTIHDSLRQGGSWPTLLDGYAKVVVETR
jgi:uncharacterized protein YndB with AHSA1/START domain